MTSYKVTVPKLNKRSYPVEDTTDKSNIVGVVNKDFVFEGSPGLTNTLGDWIKDSNGYYYWSGGVQDIPSPESVLPQTQTDLSQYWYFNRYKIPDIWLKTKGEGVKIAILDTGIMQNNLTNYWNISPDSKDYTNSGINDTDGHGTECAAIIGSRNPIALGVAPGCELVIYKTWQGDIPLAANLKSALNDAIIAGVNIISMSVEFGYLSTDDMAAIQTLIKQASDNKIILLAAIGNAAPHSGILDRIWPAAFPECIGIGALDQVGNMYPNSVVSHNLKFLVAGVNMVTIDQNGKILTGDIATSNTSFATACAAGLFALIISYAKSQGKSFDNESIQNLSILNSSHLQYTTDSGESLTFNILEPLNVINSL